MSVKADIMRNKRQVSAAPGSAHDKLISLLNILIPAFIGTIVAFLAFSPFINNSEVSFLLDKNKIDIANARMLVTEAQYRGEDDEKRPFSIKAGSAIQRTAQTPLVQLEDMSARLLFSDGPALLTANKGVYNIDRKSLIINGPMQFETANGFRMSTRDVRMNMIDKNLESHGEVTGRLPGGTFSANKMTADLDSHIVTLKGQARLHMFQK